MSFYMVKMKHSLGFIRALVNTTTFFYSFFRRGILIHSVIIGFTTCVLLLFTMLFYKKVELILAVILMIASAYFMSIVRMFVVMLRMNEDARGYFKLRVFYQAMRCSFIFIYAANSHTYFVYPIGALVAGMFAVILAIVCMPNLRGGVTIKAVKKKRFSRIIQAYSFPVFICSVIGIIYSLTDRWMVGLLMNTADVGVYSLASTVGGMPFFIFGVLSIIMLPDFYKHRSLDAKALKIIKDYSLLCIMGAIIASLILIVFFKIYVRYLPPSYENGFSVFLLTLISYIIYPLYLYGLYILRFKYLMLPIIAQVISGILINISLNLILIPFFGINGAAISSLLSVIFDIVTINIINLKIKYKNPSRFEHA